MRAFFRDVATTHGGTPAADAPYADWHRWSIDHPAEFWSALWPFVGVREPTGACALPSGPTVVGADRMAPPDTARGPRWFPDARVNVVDTYLARRDEGPALIFRGEDGERRELSFAALHEAAGRVAAALQAAGVRPGDRVAGFLPNLPETVIAMLGAAWIGAVWSSCSPDFGTPGVLDRFGQIQPVVLVVASGYRYAGKTIDLRTRVADIAAGLPSLTQVVVVPFAGVGPTVADPRALPWAEWTATAGPVPPVRPLPFDHPLFVMYSSGTTGLPKAMVHGAGGTLLQHLKEHVLHGDLRAGERIFYFTTCGWMMWNWLVSALGVGATVVLYDGAPMARDGRVLWDLAAEERVAVFGTSARFLALSEKQALRPAATHDLSALRLVLSTGSPLSPASFDYLARDVKPGVPVASISGGTDIISCFALGNPLLPVHRGELQAPGLGMAVDVFDEAGQPLRGAPGELVCTRPFPSMPVAFWDDADGAKYRAAYFEQFPGVWRHGDWAEITPRGGLVIHGRSDATLNPGGVRIGTAELYRQVETFPEVLESVVVGLEVADGPGSDVRIALFLRPVPGAVLDEAFLERLRTHIRQACSPHHVPRVLRVVRDIPRTVSGKLSELAVREALHGRPVRNTGALANPESLAEYEALGRALRG
jgi:acetoacetyl-CoA synthetase